MKLERAQRLTAEPAQASRPDPAEFLLDACRVGRPLGDDPAAPRTIEPVADWAWLLAEAERHAVTPLLFRRLAAWPDLAPPHILATLRARFDENALRNLTLARQLASLLQRLAASGVDAMPIKGPTLALASYGDLALREFADLDIVVRPRDFDRARALLGGWGYTPHTNITSAGEHALRSSDHHLPLVSEEEHLVVELHWTLGRGRLGRDDAWVWSNVRKVSILGLETPALSWSALLVYLCAHGSAHCWTRLGWVRDVAGVLAAAPPGELREAVELAAAASARRRLALGVMLAHELLGAPVPEELELSADGAVTLLVKQVRAALFADGGLGAARTMAFQCRTRDTVVDMARYCLHILAAPHVADVKAMPLPEWLGGRLYYAIRPVRLVVKRVMSLMRSR